jgi:hypothetical protein
MLAMRLLINRSIALSNIMNRIKPKAGPGRPPKLEKDKRSAGQQISVFLRLDTVQRLREGAGSRFFGGLLQEHLDRYPTPTREQYDSPKRHRNRREETYRECKSAWEVELENETRKIEREEKRLARMTPEERAEERKLLKAMDKILKEERREERRKAKANDGVGKAVSS